MAVDLTEIRDRKLVQWGLAYLAGAWLLLQLLDVLETPLSIPGAVFTGVTLLALLGFPVALVLAWYHGEQGQQRVSGPELLILGGLLGIAGTILYATSSPADEPVAQPASAEAEEAPLNRLSVAVLPFANLSPAPEEHAYFADGIHEEVISRLSKIRALRVISRTSVMSYRNAERNLREIARELGAGTILEGSVRRAGSRIRVTALLIDADRDEQLWSESFERELSAEDVFAIQTEIASRVAEALEAELTVEEEARVEDRPTNDLKAYEFYMLGIGARKRAFSEREIRHAIAMYEQAVEIDTAFAEALAKLSGVHDDMIWFAYDRSEAREEEVRRTLERARRLKPEAVEVLQTTATFHYHRARYDSARHYLLQARELERHNSEVISYLGYIQRRQGHYGEAAVLLEEALETDPRSAEIAFGLGQIYAILRRCDDALRTIRLAADLQPSWPRPPAYEAWFHVTCEGDLEAARRTLAASLPSLIDPADDAFFPLNAFLIDIFDGRYDAALTRLDGISHFNTQFSYLPAPLLRGEILRLQGRDADARARFDSARVALERRVETTPDDERYHGALAMAHAYLGNAREALDHARAAVELVADRDQYKLLYRLEDLARVHLILGDRSEAAALFQRLLREPGFLTTHLLRVDPRLRPLLESLPAAAERRP